MLLLVKLTVTPILVGLMSLAVRYLGPRLGSLIIGLPWMTGPILFILGLERGEAWVAQSCVGVQIGAGAIAAFTLAYTYAARRFGWLLSELAAAAAYFAVTVPASRLGLDALAATLLAAAALVGGYAIIKAPADARLAGKLPWWDIPARMLATAVLAFTLATTADALGPVLSGSVSTFPVIMTVIGTFTHARWGSGTVTVLFRNVLLSLLSFVAFFAVVAGTVERLGLVQSYAAAIAVTIAVSATMLVVRSLKKA